MQNINEKALAVTAEVSKAVLGKPEVVLKIMMAILARGCLLYTSPAGRAHRIYAESGRAMPTRWRGVWRENHRCRRRVQHCPCLLYTSRCV